MKTAVVILNWNGEMFLRKFLPALLESVEGTDAEVIVADNASTDGSMKLMLYEFPKVKTIRVFLQLLQTSLPTFTLSVSLFRTAHATCLKPYFGLKISVAIALSKKWKAMLTA